MLAFAYMRSIWTWSDGELPVKVSRDRPDAADESPRFDESGRLYYVENGQILRAGVTRAGLSGVGSGVLAFDVKNGSLAWVEANDDNTHAVFVDGRRLIDLGRADANDETGQVRDVRVEWSIDGSLIAISDTFLRQSLAVVRFPSGEVVFRAEGWSFAFLSATELVLRTPQEWKRLNTALPQIRVERIARFSDGTFVSSRLGSKVAIDSRTTWLPHLPRQGCACTVSVLDLTTKREVVLSRQGAAPVWVSDRRIAFTRVRSCSGEKCGTTSPLWESLGRIAVVDWPSKRVVEEFPGETFDAAARITASDRPGRSP